MKITLTPQKKQEFEQMHDSTKAVLFASEGWSSDDFSEALSIINDYFLSEK